MSILFSRQNIPMGWIIMKDKLIEFCKSIHIDAVESRQPNPITILKGFGNRSSGLHQRI